MNEERLVVDVKLTWGGDPIAVRRFVAGEVARLGDAPGSFAPLPCDAPDGFPVVRADASSARVLVPPSARARVERGGGAVEMLGELTAATLLPGDRASLELGDFTIHVATALEAWVRPKRRAFVALPFAHIALAAAAHAIVLVASGRAADASELDGQAAALDIQRTLVRAEEHARASLDPVTDGTGDGRGAWIDDVDGDGRNGGGARAARAEGVMGSHLAAPKSKGAYAVAAQRLRDPAPAPASELSFRDALASAMAGVMAQGPASPKAWSGDEEAHGRDAVAARGAMRDVAIGTSLGEDGLGLHGTGEGAGGKGNGIGLGDDGALGHTAGLTGRGTGGTGSPLTMFGGGGWGDFGSSHYTRGYIDHIGTIGQGPGRIPPETVQRIVRQNFGRFRLCYERGLARNPALTGRVMTRFVVDSAGSVVWSEDHGSDLPDAAVRACVVQAFMGLSFPRLPGSRVTVVYPLVFSPT